MHFFRNFSLTGVQVEMGATAAVFGLGTVGLAVIDGLRDVGAKRIIAIDIDPGKHAKALEWGATDAINPKDFDKPIQVLSLETCSESCKPCLAVLRSLSHTCEVILHHACCSMSAGVALGCCACVVWEGVGV